MRPLSHVDQGPCSEAPAPVEGAALRHPGSLLPASRLLIGGQRKCENRLLLNQVISQQSVQRDTRGVLPLFHFYKIKPTGDTVHLGTG